MTNPAPIGCWTFGIRTLLILMVLAAVPLAWKVNRVHSQQRAVQALQAVSSGATPPKILTIPGQAAFDLALDFAVPYSVQEWIGDDYFRDVVEIRVSQPLTTEALRGLAELPELRRIEIDDSAISAEAIEQLQKCASLKRVMVRVTSSPPNGEGLDRIRSALPGCEVRCVYVYEPSNPFLID